MSNITIRDIARYAGVSKATVSRVLNHPHVVDDKTRALVQKVIEDKHYRPSVTARNLSRRKSSTIGVILPKVDNIFFGEMLRGMIYVADKNELTVMCFNSDDSKKKDLQTLEIIEDHKVRGLIYVPAVPYEGKEERKILNKHLQALDAPAVIVDRNIGLPIDGVFFDDCAAMYEAAKSVIDAGHTRIAIINGTQERILARQRQEGFDRALEEAGITIPGEYIMLGDYNIHSAYLMTKKMMVAASTADSSHYM
ncbi:MAG: LacI family DNA-binding transcriptional regulator [Muricomes sp.]